MNNIRKYPAKFLEKIVDTTEISDFALRVFSLLLMLLAVIISLDTYQANITKKIFFFFETSETIPISIKPTLNSLIIAILLFFPVAIRQQNIKISIYSILLLICDILFTSSFISVFVSNEAWNIPLINISSTALLIFAIIMTWFGMKSLAGLVWLLLFIVSINRLTEISTAMGVYGIIYILSAFISILCQLKIINKSFLLSLREDFFGMQKQIGSDMSSFTTDLKETTKAVVQTSIGM